MDRALAPTDSDHGGMRRVLGAGHLTLLAVGAIVGGGIFSSIGQMAAGGPDGPGAGPALVVSYVLTAIACGFAALCYAEIAALLPAAGSAYSYAHVAFGVVKVAKAGTFPVIFKLSPERIACSDYKINHVVRPQNALSDAV